MHGGRGEERADDADAERDGAPVDQLPRDARLLRGRRRIDVADELDELALRALGAVYESKDADHEREHRYQREEDLVRDGAGEEEALIGHEGRGDAAQQRDGRADAL